LPPFSKENSLKAIWVAAALSLLLTGCATAPAPVETKPMNPRQNAAVQLTEEGLQALDAGQPDRAIRLFEQALGLDPYNGQCYYYLAEAWLAKGQKAQALQFNGLAAEYLKNDSEWMVRVARQADNLEALPY
jgi:Tfp pilus assembly protein PilF